MPSLKSQQISKSQQVAYDEWYKQQHAPSKANEQAADKALKVAQFKAEKAIRKQAKKETDAALKSAIEPKDDDFHSPASVQKFIDLRLKPKAKPITPSLAFALGKSPARLPLTIPLNHVNRSPSTNSASQNIHTPTMRCVACSCCPGAWLRYLHTRGTRRGPWYSPLSPPQ